MKVHHLLSLKGKTLASLHPKKQFTHQYHAWYHTLSITFIARSMRKKRLSLKNPSKELKLFSKRIAVIMIGIFLLAAAIVARLYQLQVLEHQRYTTLSEQNQLGLIPIDPNRGLIFDRNGVILAENLPVFSLDIIPSKIHNLKGLIQQLKKFIDISDDDIKGFHKLLKQKRPFEPTTLKLKLTDEEVARFGLNQWRFPGVMVNAHLLRYYPLKGTVVHAVGYVGRINEAELAQVDTANYSATNYIGKLGVEKYYEDLLHGQVGYQQVETDASGRIIRVLKRTPPIAGKNIYLSIDSNLQILAEQAFGNITGALVAIKPDTGEILAIVSNPTYDANLFVQGINQATFKVLQQDKNKPLYNRAIRGVYAPGSTAKPFYALMGLNSNVVSPTFAISDPGYFNFGNHTYKDWRKEGHGRVFLQKAVAVSCDTYFYTLALKAGVDRLSTILTQFGFGQKTGIEMEEELAGLVPTPAWKRKVKKAAWYTGDTIVMGIGQGYLLATPLQLAAGVATISRRGIVIQPHLLLKSQNSDGTFNFYKPQYGKKVSLSEEAWNYVTNGMQDVIRTSYGTGYRFGKDVSYPVAAKTGTAQVFSLKRFNYDPKNLPFELRDNSLFIAYAPADKPQIAVAVLAEHSEIAAKVARQLMDYYLLTQHHLTAPKGNALPAGKVLPPPAPR